MNDPLASGHAAPKTSGHQPAPCRLAGRLAAFLIAGSLLIVVAITADLLLRTPGQDAPAGQWMRRLNLSAPALWPAGSTMRHPEITHPGIDLRYGPGLGGAP